VGELWKNCGTGRKSWWLSFYRVTQKLVQRKSPAVKSDKGPIAMTAKSLHDPIVNEYQPHHRMCGCCEPAAQDADWWEIANAYGVSDIVVLQLGLLRKMLKSQLFATCREAVTGLREGYGRAQRLETVRMV